MMWAGVAKIGMRVVAIATAVGVILGAMALIIIPTPDFTVLGSAISKVLAIVYYWVPGASTFIPLTFDVLAFVTGALIVVELGIIGSRFITNSLGSD